ncbi:RNA-binding protein 44 [Eucyclogobius newberryi]|uniref:RNA-binding protein 44 n=1 Tax=Eucyclogobius newberryi TaxID=166745 RepID=UPI003B5B698E
MVNPNGDYYGFKNPEQFTNLSLEVELEKQTQGVNPQSTAFDSIGDAMTRQSGHETSQNEDFYSILEADQSIVLCVPNQSPDTSQINAGELISENEASSMESIIRSTEDRSTPVCARHVMVGTEQTMTMSALSQTDPQQMTDRHLNTEVYMSDLDYLTKEFIAIKTERDELLEKVKMQRIPSPLARIVNDLKKLETDSNKMKEKILSGIPLQDLKPFSLDEGETDNSTVTTVGCSTRIKKTKSY